ncbi:ATP-binding protein [Niveibacterium sp. COAC-50]|uniref:ATP-binding protein n=1 Tax=Niveibacterium sp. COAC-50 TaxID=2729384 RepID=UPI001552492E|nr:ATP-binding protein [Niveibacterium sp. COAC-50]
MTEFNPYAGNILVDGLGPILSRFDRQRRLMMIPTMPKDAIGAPRHLRLHVLARLRDLHIVRREDLRVADSIDLAIRESYRYRDPRLAATWGLVSAEPMLMQAPRAPAQSMVISGHSGTGKTDTVLRILHSYPAQVIKHMSFPRLEGPHFQMTWLCVDVPPNGKAESLADVLMQAWDDTMTRANAEHVPRFWRTREAGRRDGARMLEEWRQVATSHFLGVLVLDEVQNLFNLPALKARSRRGRVDASDDSACLELSIVEDQVLRWILTLMNTWGIALILIGTPDGVQGLMRRLAFAERAVTGGYHCMRVFGGMQDEEFSDYFLPSLTAFQGVAKPLHVSPELGALLMELTAGIPRLLVALWVAAHRVAYEHKADTLTEADIRKAAGTYLAPVMPAVAALRSNDPRQMRRYEDLLPRDWDVWSDLFAQQVSAQV